MKRTIDELYDQAQKDFNTIISAMGLFAIIGITTGLGYTKILEWKLDKIEQKINTLIEKDK